MKKKVPKTADVTRVRVRSLDLECDATVAAGKKSAAGALVAAADEAQASKAAALELGLEGQNTSRRRLNRTNPTAKLTCKRKADASQGLSFASHPAAALTPSRGSAWYTANAASPGGGWMPPAGEHAW